jgi:OFA family oxalate/formate antiporter-like MFS transporter
MQVCLGIFYSYSVFRAPLEQAYGWSRADSIVPYRWSFLFFLLGTILAGFWQDRKGPRIVATAGGLLLAAGFALAAATGQTVSGLTLAYGVLASLGVGIAYVTPVACCVKWFPDKRGLMVGLAVMGFGFGSLLFAPLLEVLLGKDPTQYTRTLPNTFLTLAAIFLAGVVSAAQFYAVPPAGWTPPHWTPPASSSGPKPELAPAQLLGEPRFYFLWLVYFLGSAIGLTAIGESAPLVRDLAGKSAVMSGGMALGVMSIFNGGGRLLWGAVSDKFGSRVSLLCLPFCFLLATGLVLPQATGFWAVLLGLCLVGFSYGGYLSLMPSLTAEYFGPKHIGANYGLLFSAWGLAGFFIPRYAAQVLEAAKQAGQLLAGYHQLFLTLAALAALALVPSFFLTRRR